MKNVVHNVKSYCGWTLAEYGTVVYDTLTRVRHLGTISRLQNRKQKLAAARMGSQFPLYEHRHVNTEIFDMSNQFQVVCTILVLILLFSSSFYV